MEKLKDAYMLSTGKMISVNGGIIGLNRNDDQPRWEMCEGYDGYIFVSGSDYYEKLTPEELHEIADYMIDLWTQFKEEAGG